MTERFASTLLGVNTFQLRRYPGIQMGDVSRETRRAWRRRPRLSYEDAEAVAAGLSVPTVTAWESQAGADVVYEGSVARGIWVYGVTEDYFQIKNWNLEHGRPFTAQEVRAGIPVIVIGSELADRLFDNRDPIGRQVRIRDVPYRVVGVVEPQGNLFGISLDKFVVAPALSPIKRLVNPRAWSTRCSCRPPRSRNWKRPCSMPKRSCGVVGSCARPRSPISRSRRRTPSSTSGARSTRS
jgi:putative ABC transport system permease protein